MKIKTSELSEGALDWAVAVARYDRERVGVGKFYAKGILRLFTSKTDYFAATVDGCLYRPSVEWVQGGPIIEQECITVSALYAQKNPPSPEYAHGTWGAYIPCGISSEAAGKGRAPLTAAMRCYVVSKLGDEVDIPEELLK